MDFWHRNRNFPLARMSMHARNRFQADLYMIYLAAPLSYDPNHLLNVVMHRLGLKSDGALALRLKLARALIRDIRACRLPISATITLVIHHATGISVDELRRLMGDRRATFRLGASGRMVNGAWRRLAVKVR
jgi:hypothetical protein